MRCKIKSKTVIIMEEFDTMDATEAVDTTAVAVETTTETLEPSAPEKRVSKTMAWARAHVGFIEILDPELRAQLSYYRKRNRQITQTMHQEEIVK